MSQSSPPRSDDRTLHRYHDGELAAEERAAVAAALDDGDRDKLAALEDMGGALRAVCAAPVSLDLWPEIEKGLGATVVPLARRRRRRVTLWLSSLAVAAALVVATLPRSSAHPSNDCDIDELEVDGASATILQLEDEDHGGSTTVLWMRE